MTNEYLFETIWFEGEEAGREFEQEWLGQELGEFEEEGEFGGGRGRAGRRRPPRPIRPRAYRPGFGRASAAMPGWLAIPAAEPPADSGQPCGCAPPCDCAACQGDPQAPAEPADPPGEEEFGFETGAGEMFETLEFESAGPGRPAAAPAASCATSFVDCPPRGAPSAVLDAFAFDRSDLNAPRHGPVLVDVARRVIASQGTRAPIRALLIAGHTDPVGDDNYNFGLARRRAENVARELCRTIERMKPGGTRGLSLKLTSCGERQTKGRPEQSRRVEIHLPPAAPPPGRKNPPDHSHCGVPRRALQREAEFEAELQAEFQAELEAEFQTEVGTEFEAPTPPRRPQAQKLQPRLCLYQDHPTTSHRNHFRCQADRWAKRIAAQASPTTDSCPKRVGGTPYGSGADIIAAIGAAHRCQRRRLDAVHIFSHSGSYGIFGTTGGSVGLYTSTNSQSRTQGARTMTDIPIAAVAENVVFVLHGCNAASGTDNVALALYNHLAAKLRNPKVFGHTNSGCAGRDNSWREYSKRSPDGKVRLSRLKPHYEGDGCCG